MSADAHANAYTNADANVNGIRTKSNMSPRRWGDIIKGFNGLVC